ncbi:uncharacterized protein LOC107361273 [Tetranychus urticae]|uniref:Uncharacterized protein n=1 Tax=Tetranychus urticae TaxID=32264 RepID=T1K7T1_TETUR|nr:uncharacterized protein LOC107361273 [Tetranychus urticae]
MQLNVIDGSAKLFTSQRRTPSRYNLTKLASDNFFLKSLSFKTLPGSIIIRRIVIVFTFAGNVFNLYLRSSMLFTLNDIKFKQVFDIFEQSIFCLCFIFISSGPFHINLDNFYENFDSIWRRIIIAQGTVCETFILSETKRINRELIVMLLLGTTMLLGFALLGIFGKDELWQASITFFALAYTLYLNIGYIYILRLSVGLIKAGFQSIESRLETCSVTLANLGHVRLCRQSHNQIIQLIDLLQTTFKHVFSAFICFFVPQFVFGFYQLAVSSQTILINVVTIGWNSVNFYFVLILAEGLILLNTLPQSYYLALYLTSFGDISGLVKIEINHYLNYVASKDVGFRLWGNFLVNNELIPKLCAVVFSYLTAGVSFLQ